MAEPTPEKRGRGRPRELTREIVDQVASLVTKCLYVETVAGSLGINRDTFRLWCKIGAREHRNRERGQIPNQSLDLFVEFSGNIKKALADAEADFLATVQASGTQAWTALAWILERRFPERWSANRAELKVLQKRLEELEKRCSPNGKSTHADELSGDAADTPVTVDSVK
jgi:hypothetical protein